MEVKVPTISNAEYLAICCETIIEGRGYIPLVDSDGKKTGHVKNVYVDGNDLKIDFYSTSWKHPGRTYYGMKVKGNIYTDDNNLKADFYSTGWKHPDRSYYGVELEDID